jgi:hypothetical protein
MPLADFSSRCAVACKVFLPDMNNYLILSMRKGMKPLLMALLLIPVAYCHAAPILPEEAKNHVGENASVRGLVEQVSVSKKGHMFLNCGGQYPNHIFTGFIPARNVAAVGGLQFLQSLAGNPITLSGKIELYKGRPEIVISSPSQIVKE